MVYFESCPNCQTIVFNTSKAGKATTDEELEEMLEGGNSAVFTAGVRQCQNKCYKTENM